MTAIDWMQQARDMADKLTRSRGITHYAVYWNKRMWAVTWMQWFRLNNCNGRMFYTGRYS